MFSKGRGWRLVYSFPRTGKYRIDWTRAGENGRMSGRARWWRERKPTGLEERRQNAHAPFLRDASSQMSRDRITHCKWGK